MTVRQASPFHNAKSINSKVFTSFCQRHVTQKTQLHQPSRVMGADNQLLVAERQQHQPIYQKQRFTISPKCEHNDWKYELGCCCSKYVHLRLHKILCTLKTCIGKQRDDTGLRQVSASRPPADRARSHNGTARESCRLADDEACSNGEGGKHRGDQIELRPWMNTAHHARYFRAWRPPPAPGPH